VIVRVWFLTLLALVLTACAPMTQKPLVSPAMFSAPHFEADAFVSFDGARLGLSHWRPSEGEPWAVIVALHGMNDYGEAFYLAGPAWAAAGIATYAYDARGFGRSPRRGVWAGEDLLLADLGAAVSAARRAHPGAIVAVVGDSMGAATALAAFGSDNPPAADRLVLVAPAVWGWSTLPDLYAATLWIGAHTFPYRPVTPPRNVQRRIIPSDNVEMLRRIGRDPNMLFETRIDAVYGLVSLMESASRAAGRTRVPTAFLFGAKDQIVPRPSAEAAARRLPPGAVTALYPDGHHMLLRDLNADRVWGDVVGFLRDPASPLNSAPPPLLAPKQTLTAAR
jgi:alpha-beta hydrolase superfamily lysophospholipase